MLRARRKSPDFFIKVRTFRKSPDFSRHVFSRGCDQYFTPSDYVCCVAAVSLLRLPRHCGLRSPDCDFCSITIFLPSRHNACPAPSRHVFSRGCDQYFTPSDTFTAGSCLSRAIATRTSRGVAINACIFRLPVANCLVTFVTYRQRPNCALQQNITNNNKKEQQKQTTKGGLWPPERSRQQMKSHGTRQGETAATHGRTEALSRFAGGGVKSDYDQQ